MTLKLESSPAFPVTLGISLHRSHTLTTGTLLKGGAQSPLGHFWPRARQVLWDFWACYWIPCRLNNLNPSALIIHSNTPIQRGESCFCITQYARGGPFPLGRNGFMSDICWHNNATPEQLQACLTEQGARWAQAARMFTTKYFTFCSYFCNYPVPCPHVTHHSVFHTHF